MPAAAKSYCVLMRTPEGCLVAQGGLPATFTIVSVLPHVVDCFCTAPCPQPDALVSVEVLDGLPSSTEPGSHDDSSGPVVMAELVDSGSVEGADTSKGDASGRAVLGGGQASSKDIQKGGKK